MMDKTTNKELDIEIACLIEFLYDESKIKYCDLDKKQKMIYKSLLDPSFSKKALRIIISDLLLENSNLKNENNRLSTEKFSNNSESSSNITSKGSKGEKRKLREEGADVDKDKDNNGKPNEDNNSNKNEDEDKEPKYITTKVCALFKADILKDGDMYENFKIKLEEVFPKLCKTCGTQMKKTGSYDLSAKICIERSYFYIKIFKRYVGKCQNKECEEYGELQRNEVEDDAKKQILSVGLTAQLAVEKYLKAVPVYTQRFLKLPITYETMLNSIMWLSEKLEPLAKRIEDSLFEKDDYPYLYIDETYFTVTYPAVKENGQERKKNYVFVMANKKAIFYKTTETMSRKADWFTNRISGLEHVIYVISDDFSGYNCLAPEIHQLCLCHARRIIYYAVLAIPDEEMIKDSNAYKLLLSINSIFKKEREIKDLPYNLRKRTRKSKEYTNLINNFKYQLIECRKTSIKGTKLRQAVEYTLDNWDKLWTYINVGFIECHNTTAELAVKVLAKLRKTSMNFNNPSSAKKNCDLLSIVQTALMYNIDVYEYIMYVQHYIDIEPIDNLLPWSKNLYRLPKPKYE